MAPQFEVVNISANGAELNATIDRIEDALSESSMEASVIACLSMVVLLQRPDLDVSKLPDMVMDISKYVCDRIMKDGEDEDDLSNYDFKGLKH